MKPGVLNSMPTCSSSSWEIPHAQLWKTEWKPVKELGILLSSLPRWGRPYTFSVCHLTRSLSHIITHRCDNFSGFCLWRHSVRVGNLVGISDKKMRAWIENRQGLKALRMAASCQNSNKNIYQLPPSLFFKAAGDSRSKILYNPSLLTITNSSLALLILFLARHRAQVTSSVTI